MSLLSKRDKIVTLCAIIIGIIIWFLPEGGGLTKAGIQMLAVFVPTIILWVGIGTSWTSILSLLMCVLLQVPKATGSFTTAWSSGVPLMVVPMLIVVNVLIESGGMKYITQWMLSRKFIHGRPYVFMFMLCVAVVLVGVAVYAVIMCTFLLSFVAGICDDIGYNKESKFYKSLLFLALWICTITDGVMTFARPIPLLIIAYLEGMGYAISTLQWHLVSIPFAFMCILIALAVIKFIYRPDVANFKNYDDAAMRADLEAHPLNKRGKMACASIVFIILCWLMPSLGLGVVSTYFGKLPFCVAPYICLMVMAFTDDEEGKPCLDLGAGFKGINWLLPIFIGTIMFYSGIVGLEEYGLTAAISNLLAPITETLGVTGLIALGLVAVCLLTNFMSSTVATTIVIYIFVPLLISGGIDVGNMIVFGVLVGCVSNCAYLTHAACPASGVILSAVPSKESIKYNILICALELLFTILLFRPLFASLMG